MKLGDRSWRLMTRYVGFASRRLVDMEFDELMSIGCNLVSRFEGSDAVSLTFDDGPTSHSTRKILSALEKYGVRGTFFCIGNNAIKHPEIVREIAARGHEVANHTLTHADLHRALPSQLRREVTACHQILSEITNTPIVSFRAPYGRFRWDLRNISHFSGERALVHWDVCPPFFETDPAILSDYILRRVRNGSIVDLHDGLARPDEALSVAVGKAVASCLQTVIPGLLSRGYEVRTIAEQLQGSVD
jgi:peptidoglycan/xylan/chitin deacetylase (PgdA/CDA1 family)